MKLLILVLSMKDGGIYDNFYETQKKTWDSIEVDGVETFYFFGNQIENKVVGNEILTSVPESLFNCGYKTLQALDLIKNLEFDYIFRTNSSSYVDKKLIKEFLKDKPTSNFYSAILGFDNEIRFGSGCGYFLSKDLVNLVLENKNLWDHSIIDDISMAKLLLNFGIVPQESKRYDILGIDSLPLDHFHYRFKTNYREMDIKNMKTLHSLKCN